MMKWHVSERQIHLFFFDNFAMHVINVYVFQCNVQKDTSAWHEGKTVLKVAS